MAEYLPAGEEDDFDDGFILDSEELSEMTTTYKPTNELNGRTPPEKTGVGTEKYVKLSTEDFHNAAMKKDMNILVECLKQGIPIDTVLRSGWTALMYAANSADPDLVAFLLTNGANANFHTNKYSVLMAACGSNNSADSVFECVRLLVEKGANVNDYDRYHISPLLYAAREGQKEVVQLLLNHRANKNKQDSRGWTALSWATHRQHTEVVKLLLSAECDKRLKHTDGLLPIDIAIGQDNQQLIALLEGKPVAPVASAAPVVQNGSTSNNTRINGHLQPLQNGSGDSSEEKSVMASDYSFANSSRLSFNNIREAIKESTSQLSSKSSSAPTDQRTSTSKTRAPSLALTSTDYVKFGELELFLSGLGFTDFIELFHNHNVDFDMLLCLDEEDFINMGINQVGVRKKLLEGIKTVHKKEWKESSLIAPQYNKHIRCSDAVAMVSNISRHALYISSSIVYITDQIKKQPHILQDIEDDVAPCHLATQTNDALKNVTALKSHLDTLQKRLHREMKMLECEPPDLIKIKKTRRRRKVVTVVSSVVIVSTLGLLLWKKDSVSHYINHVLDKYTS